jgi:hypothetical protein
LSFIFRVCNSLGIEPTHVRAGHNINFRQRSITDFAC